MDGSAVRIPDLIEPFDGYRSWSYSVDQGRARLFPLKLIDLRALSAAHDGSSIWEGGWRRWVTASCALDPSGRSHEAPDEECSCGFYALKDPSAVMFPWSLPGVRGPFDDDVLTGVVSGRVALAGKVIEHEHGFRAERARIYELIVSPDDIDGTILVATLLDLPVVAGKAPNEGAEVPSGLVGRRFRSSSRRPRGLPPAA